MKGPGLFSDIGKKAKDLLNKDYSSDRKLTISICNASRVWLVWRKYFGWRIWASQVPVAGRILLTSITKLSFNIFGFCAALFGCLATSTMTILAESLLHGFKFHR